MGKLGAVEPVKVLSAWISDKGIVCVGQWVRSRSVNFTVVRSIPTCNIYIFFFLFNGMRSDS